MFKKDIQSIVFMEVFKIKKDLQWIQNKLTGVNGFLHIMTDLNVRRVVFFT